MVRGELTEKTVLEWRSQEHQGANLKVFCRGKGCCGGSKCKGSGVGAAGCVSGTAERSGGQCAPLGQGRSDWH